MQLFIDENVIRAAWGSAGEYWFSRIDYAIYKSMDLPESDSVKLFDAGFIPFVTVTNEEVIRGYVAAMDNRKIAEKLEKLDSEEYIETFWKYFNAYKEISDTFSDFEKSYVTSEIVSWCDEHSVDYKIEE